MVSRIQVELLVVSIWVITVVCSCPYFNVISTVFVSGFILTSLLCVVYLQLNIPTENESENKQNFRPNADNGLWCCLLVPMSLISQGDDNHSQAIVLLTALTTVCVTLVYVRDWHPHRVYMGLIMLALGCILPLVVFERLAVIVILCVSSLLFLLLLHNLPQLFPESFTLGEAVVICQLIVVFAVKKLLSAISVSQTPKAVNYDTEINSFVQVVVFGIVFLYLSVYTFHVLHAPIMFWSLYLLTAFTIVLPGMWCALGQNPFIWLLGYLIQSKTNISLFMFYAGLLCLILLVVLVNTENSPRLSSTITRKYFHFLILLVFVPGTVVNRQFMYFASTMIISLFIILEHFRLYSIPPIGTLVDKQFRQFLDEKDKGRLIVSHLYLLLGASLPLWFSDLHKAPTLQLWAGVLSIGVGDTAASIGGSMYGKHQWPGTKKTVEGTVIAILAQLVFCFLFFIFGLSALPISPVVHVIFSVMVISLIEAFTTQIDNLILPLLAFSLLSVT